jgi:hypothetical protein
MAFGSCHVDRRIQELPGAEAFDTATIMVTLDTESTERETQSREHRELIDTSDSRVGQGLSFPLPPLSLPSSLCFSQVLTPLFAVL